MKLQGFKQYLFALLLLGFCSSGWAAFYPIPDPLPPGTPEGLDLGADIDGNGLFIPGVSLLTLEIFDREESTLAPGGYEFGFYYDSLTPELVPIFQTNDNTSAFRQRASVNFSTGVVFDRDAGAVQNTFDSSPGIAPIGFYVRLPGATPLYTQASRNGGIDLSAAYPISGTLPSGRVLADAYLLGFATIPGDLTSTQYVSVVGPLSPVPLPGAIFLWMTGLAGLALFRRSLGAGRSVTAPTT